MTECNNLKCSWYKYCNAHNDSECLHYISSEPSEILKYKQIMILEKDYDMVIKLLKEKGLLYET